MSFPVVETSLCNSSESLDDLGVDAYLRSLESRVRNLDGSVLLARTKSFGEEVAQMSAEDEDYKVKYAVLKTMQYLLLPASNQLPHQTQSPEVRQKQKLQNSSDKRKVKYAKVKRNWRKKRIPSKGPDNSSLSDGSSFWADQKSEREEQQKEQRNQRHRRRVPDLEL
ncbi:YALIA101S15e00584g1_1 [Yarrowia lipolytica]|nr:Hypothetical protein YALI2_A00474g [Yarrowia lipolytica]SEI36900.1 YALIA101S15e00584g1_1 [Yarrowia lipolytica]